MYVCPAKSCIKARHDMVRNATAACASLDTRSRLVAEMEPKLLEHDRFRIALLPTTGQTMPETRADLCLSVPSSNKEPLFADIQVTHPRPKDGLSAPGNNADIAVKKAEAKKRHHYRTMFLEATADLVTPFIVDTYGQIGPAATKFLASITDRFAGVIVTDRTTYLRRFHEQISVALQRGNYYVLRAYSQKYVAPQHWPAWLGVTLPSQG